MSLATGQTFWEAILPGLLLVALAIAVLPWLNRDRVWARSVPIGICLFLTWRYLLWRAFDTLPPADITTDFIVGIAFFAVEALCIFGTTIACQFYDTMERLTRCSNISVSFVKIRRSIDTAQSSICGVLSFVTDKPLGYPQLVRPN